MVCQRGGKIKDFVWEVFILQYIVGIKMICQIDCCIDKFGAEEAISPRDIKLGIRSR